MRRLHLIARHLRLCIVAVLGAYAMAQLAVARLFDEYLLDLPAQSLRTQGWTALIGGASWVVLTGTYAAWRARPLTALVARSTGGGPSTARAHDALSAALQLGARMAGAAGLGWVVLIAAGAAIDMTLLNMPAVLALQRALRATAFALVGAIALYVACRRWVGPIIVHLAQQQLPASTGVSLRVQIIYVITGLALLAAMPALEAATGGARELQRHAQLDYDRHLAQTLAAGAAFLGPDQLREVAAAARLDHARIRFAGGAHAGLPAAAAGLPATHGTAQVQVIGGPERLPLPGATAPWAVTGLLLALALYSASELGNGLGTDLRRATRRMAQLRETAGEQSPPAELPPPPAAASRFAELRELLDAVDEVWRRMAQMQLAHFVALEKMIEVDRLRTQFLANMSHDLRGPLNSILGFCELLLRGLEGELTAAQREDLCVIQRNGQRLSRLIGQVLDAARVDSNRMRLHREDSPAAEILRLALRDLRQRELPDAIRIETELQPGLPVVWVDAQRVAEALSHLGYFCAAAMGRGTVWIRARARPSPAGQGLQILQLGACCDGVAPQQSDDELFEGFRRIRGKRGLGLELRLARAYVELHGGTLRLERGVPAGVEVVAEIPVEQRRTIGRLRPVRV